MRVPRRIALALLAALVAAASLVSFAESYRGLYLWAHRHGLGSTVNTGYLWSLSYSLILRLTCVQAG